MQILQKLIIIGGYRRTYSHDWCLCAIIFWRPSIHWLLFVPFHSLDWKVNAANSFIFALNLLQQNNINNLEEHDQTTDRTCLLSCNILLESTQINSNQSNTNKPFSSNFMLFSGTKSSPFLFHESSLEYLIDNSFYHSRWIFLLDWWSEPQMVLLTMKTNSCGLFFF